MSNTTQKLPATFKRITKRELNERLKVARAEIRQLKAEGKPLPNPTKEWSKESFESLSAALSGR